MLKIWPICYSCNATADVSVSTGPKSSSSDNQNSRRVSIAHTTKSPESPLQNLELIGAWFKLVHNMRAKYGIHDCDLYNFDETGFMMGVICASMVVTRADRRGRAKAVQPGNSEWTTAIECINGEGWCLPPFLIVQGTYHLANWYTESNLPLDWALKPTSNGWTDNETGLEWIKHFDKHTKSRTKGVYRLIVLDAHESHLSAKFEAFCKQNNIATISLPAHSSHITQPLDVGCFSVLKTAYGRQIEHFVRAHINHITKVEFFLAFKAAHFAAMTESNNRGGFRAAGLVPFDPDSVISKLDVKSRMPTPTGPPSALPILGPPRRHGTQQRLSRNPSTSKVGLPVTREARRRKFSLLSTSLRRGRRRWRTRLP